MSDLSIVNRSVSELKPYARNARTHSKKQIRQIANSIRRFGFTNPILVDDELQIIAGHGRVEAAKGLGIDQVPTIRLAGMSEADKRAYVLADNRLAEKAGWDKEILAIELQALLDLDFEIELTGFEMPEIDIILDEAAEAQGSGSGPEDSVPAYPAGNPPVTRAGDLWELGEHRLLCGDARDQANYERLLDGTLAELVFTDPPYNVKIDGHVCGLGRIRHQDFAMGCGEMNPSQFIAFLERGFHLLAAHSTRGSIHFVCMDWRHVAEIMAAGRAVYNELKNICVWNKTNAGMGSFYRSKHELVFVFKNGTGTHTNNFELGQYGRTRSNVWDYAGVNTLRRGGREELALHPTVKPTALVADAIKDCSHRGGVVLDPFAGSGTILIACERTGRKARALEIDPRYIDVAVKRWESYTGKNATLAGTGETFEQISEARVTSGDCDKRVKEENGPEARYPLDPVDSCRLAPEECGWSATPSRPEGVGK
jgi:DNA modification methylase